jgi:hypothetical protein
MATRSFYQQNVRPETTCLAAICLMDLATTLYWVALGHAREGNPVMASILNAGFTWFILAKVLGFAPALIAAEWYRPRNPALIDRVLRWVIGGYVVLWLAGIATHTGGVGEFYARLLEPWLG